MFFVSFLAQTTVQFMNRLQKDFSKENKNVSVIYVSKLNVDNIILLIRIGFSFCFL